MNNVRILIVDDNPETLRTYKKAIGRKVKTQALEIETVDTVPAALEKLRNSRFDILVADLKIPGSSGGEFGEFGGLEIITESQTLDPLRPVIVITGFGSVELARKTFTRGAFDFIEKSRDAVNSLVEAVQRAIDSYGEKAKVHEKHRGMDADAIAEEPRDLKQSLLIKKTTKNEFFNKTNKKALPYALKQIGIKNFCGIIDTRVSGLPLDTQWIFLTGENGFGKTSVLQALAVGLFGHRDGDKILADEKSKIGVEFHSGSGSRVNNLWHPSFKPFSIFAAYGSARLEIQSRQSENEISQKSSKMYGLFESDGILLSIEYQLLIWYLDKDPKFGIVKETLSRVLPYIEDIRIIDKEVLYTEKEMTENGGTYEPMPYKKLASGYRSIIAMVGDMVIRLFKEQPDVSDPKYLYGIVIIDELDLHLHPRWQRELPALLSAVFPNVQFIASTHSVIPFLGAPGNSVFLKVTRNKEQGIQLQRIDIDIRHLLPNSILTSPIFDLEGGEITQMNKEHILDVRTEDDYKKILKNDKIKANLQDFEKSDADFPDDLFNND